MMTDQQAARVGWYYDPLHQQPVYLFWDRAVWRAHFVWHDPLTDTTFDDGGKLSGHDESLTHDMYHRLVPLGQTGVQDYTRVGGCAIRELDEMRHSVQVKPSIDGRGVFVQSPAMDDRGQCDPSCQVVWLSDDEIPTVIRALQARRRAILDRPDTRDTTEEHGE
jgi:hypothetical protein